MRNLNITQQNLYLLLPPKISWLANMLAEDKGITIVEAMNILYTSSFHAYSARTRGCRKRSAVDMRCMRRDATAKLWRHIPLRKPWH